MPNRRLLIAMSVIVALAPAGCAFQSQAGSAPPTLSTGSRPEAGEKGMSSYERAAALAAAHQEANEIAVGRDSNPASDWPSGISAVLAAVAPGTVADSNTGHTCESGTLISVRLLGAFDTVTTGRATGTDTSRSDTTIREIDLSVDGRTGLTCLLSVRIEPLAQSGAELMLYRR